MNTTTELHLAGAEPVAEVITDGNGLRLLRPLPAGTKLYTRATPQASSKGGEAVAELPSVVSDEQADQYARTHAAKLAKHHPAALVRALARLAAKDGAAGQERDGAVADMRARLRQEANQHGRWHKIAVELQWKLEKVLAEQLTKQGDRDPKVSAFNEVVQVINKAETAWRSALAAPGAAITAREQEALVESPWVCDCGIERLFPAPCGECGTAARTAASAMNNPVSVNERDDDWLSLMCDLDAVCTLARTHGITDKKDDEAATEAKKRAIAKKWVASREEAPAAPQQSAPLAETGAAVNNVSDLVDDFERDHNGFHLQPEHYAEWFEKLRKALTAAQPADGKGAGS